MDERSRTLLLVEDEALIALNKKMQLEKIGYSVSHVLTGEAAVSHALNPDSRSDLVLMDIDLGKGIDGTQAAEQILSEIEIPVVFVSSHTEPEVVEKTEKITSYGYVVKNSGIMVLDASIKMAFKLFESKQRHARTEVEYRRLFNTMPTGIVHESADGTITSVNPAAERMLGRDLMDLVGKSSMASTWQMIDEAGNGVRDYEDPVMLAFKTGETIGPVERGVFVSEKGEYVWLKITATPLFNPGETTPYECYASLEDISAQKHVENESNRRNHLVQKIFEYSVDLISITDLQGRFKFVSKSHEVLGYDADDLIGNNALDYVHPDDLVSLQDIFARIVNFQEQQTSDYRYRMSNGEYRWLETTGTLLTGDDGKPEQILFNTRDITERKQANEQLRRVLNEYDTVFNGTQDALFLVDVIDEDTYRYMRNNRAHAEETGIPMEQLQNKTPQELLGTELGDEISANYRRCYHAGHPISYEETLDLPGGKKTWFTMLTPIFDEGEIHHLVGATHEFTERKNVEKKLQERDTLLQRIFENSADLIAIINLDGTIQTASTSDALLGYDLESVIGETVTDFVHPDDTEAVALAIRNIPELDSNRTGQYRLKRANGEYAWVETHETVLRDANGNPEQLLVNARDITERKKVEEELRESHENFKTLFDVTPNATLVADASTGIIVNANTAAEYLFEVPVKNLIGMHHTHLYSYDQRETADAEFKQAAESELFNAAPVPLELVIETPSGVKKTVELVGNILHAENTPQLLGTFFDITQRKQTEEEIHRQLAEKETLLKEVHHRIKNNMAQIESLLSIQADSAESADVRAALNTAMSRVQSTRILYEKLLVGKGQDEVSIKDYLESLIESHIEVYNDNVGVITIDKNIVDFSFSAKKAIPVGIILNELLTNVFKYAFGDRAEGRVAIELKKSGSQVTLTVQDNGVGFDARAAANKSTGFGLTLTKMLAEQLEGTFTMESDNGTKSVVAFEV